MNDNLAASARNQPYYQALIVSGNAEVSGVQGNGRKVEATAVIETVHRIAETNGFAVTVEVDQTSHGIQGRTAHRRHHIAAVKALRESVVALEAETGRRLQVLINNAGRIEWTGGPLWDADPESLKDVVEANVLGVALKVNVFAPVLMAGAGPSRIIGLNSGSGAKVTPAQAVYSASKASLFRIADSVVHFGHDKGQCIFEMAPGVVETAMKQSMPIHDFRGEGDWTTPADATDLALALASGTLDAFAGRYVRAGADSEESLLVEVAAGLSDSARRIMHG